MILWIIRIITLIVIIFAIFVNSFLMNCPLSRININHVTYSYIPIKTKIRFKNGNLHETLIENTDNNDFVSESLENMPFRKAMNLLSKSLLSPLKANMLLENMLIQSNKNTFSENTWYELLDSAMQYNFVPYTIRLYNFMAAQGINISAHQMTKLLSFLNSSGCHKESSKILLEALAKGYEPTVHNFSSLLKCGTPEDAIKYLILMNSLNVPANVITYTAAIKSCETLGDWKTALKILDLMRINNIKPNEITYCCIISVAARGYAGSIALFILQEMNALGFAPNPLCYGGALCALARSGMWDDVSSVLNRMEKENVALQESVLISVIGACKSLSVTGNPGLAMSNNLLNISNKTLDVGDVILTNSSIQWERAIWLLSTYANRTNQLSDSAFTMCMDICESAGRHLEVLQLHELMMQYDIQMSKSSLAFVLRALRHYGELETSLVLLKEAKRLKFASIPMYYTIINTSTSINRYDVASSLLIDVLLDLKQNKVSPMTEFQVLGEQRAIIYEILANYSSFNGSEIIQKNTFQLFQLMFSSKTTMVYSEHIKSSSSENFAIQFLNGMKDMQISSISSALVYIFVVNESIGINLLTLILNHKISFTNPFTLYDVIEIVKRLILFDKYETAYKVSKSILSNIPHLIDRDILQHERINIVGELVIDTLGALYDELKNISSTGLHESLYTLAAQICYENKYLEGVLDIYKTATQHGKISNSLREVAIFSFSKSDYWDTAIDIFEEFKDIAIVNNQTISSEIYCAILLACEKGNDWELAIKTLDDVKSMGRKLTSNMVTSGIFTCASCGRIEEALQLINYMIDTNIPQTRWTYAAAISACGKKGRWKDALKIFEKMRLTEVHESCDENLCKEFEEDYFQIQKSHSNSTNFVSNMVTYNVMIEALGVGGQIHLIDELYREAVLENIVNPLRNLSHGFIDLHDHSVHMAKAAIRYCLELIVRQNDILNIHHDPNESEQELVINQQTPSYSTFFEHATQRPKMQGLIIIVGKGLRLQKEIQNQLRMEFNPSIKSFIVHGNTGRLIIPTKDLRKWIDFHRDSRYNIIRYDES